MSLSGVGAGLTSEAAVDHALIDALLDPLNATDWPMFKVVLGDLVRVAEDLGGASGILASEPGFDHGSTHGSG